MTLQTWRELARLNRCVIACRRCPRLTQHIARVAETKVPRFKNQRYWGKPVPGFGDENAVLMIIGLAPAAHGANRTGRMFTGDSSGNWLMRALFETGFANQPRSEQRNDGLTLTSAYITATVRCAPPGNRPLRSEIGNCSEYLRKELRLLRHLRVVLTLGRIAFENYVILSGVERRLAFQHGAVYDVGEGKPILVASYHPSRQNTQTGRLTWPDWIRVFKEVRRLVAASS